MRLIGIGDNVVDYYKHRSEMYPGGNAVNVAVLSRRYGAESCAYLGLVGDDAAGALILESLGSEGIDISRIRQAAGGNERSVIALDEEGDRVFVGTVQGVQSRLKLLLDAEDLAYIRGFDLIHTSVYSHFDGELPKLKGVAPVAYDFSTKRDPELLERVCPHLAFAFFSGGDLSEEECEGLIRQVHSYGVGVVGVTRGSRGALFSDGAQTYVQPALPAASVVDTLGAGDSFIAMFLTRYMDGVEIRSALYEAAGAAAANCGIYGAFGHGTAGDGIYE